MNLVEKNAIAEVLSTYAKECNCALVHNDDFDYYNDRFNIILNLAKRLDTSFDCIMLGNFKIGIIFKHNETIHKIIHYNILKTAINSLYGFGNINMEKYFK